jgi:AraC family transcriptional regulator, transcriptional activator of pobA
MIQSKLKLQPERLFKLSRMKEVIKPTRPHKHEGYYEFILLTQGAGYHTIDDQKYEVTPPLFHILKPSQIHCWDFTQIPIGFVLMVREEFLGSNSAIRQKLYELPVEIKLKDAESYLYLYEQCFVEYQQGELHQDTIKAYLNLIITKLFHQGRAQEIFDFPSHQMLYQYKKLVDLHFIRYKQVKQYAGLLNISAARLNEICKKSLGKNAQAIIQERVVLEAKNLLFHTDTTVAEISYHLQFSDASNFVKFFKAQTTLTPQQYRKMR